MTRRTTPRVLVVEDDPLAARALARLLSLDPVVAVIAPDVRAARAHLAPSTAWAGVLCDFELPDGTALDVLAALAQRPIRAPALVLTGHDAAELPNAVARLRVPFLRKPASVEDLAPFIADVRGPGALAAALTEELTELRLTERQMRIVALAVLERRTYEEIARELDITPHTVKHHARRALERARLVRLSDFRDRIVRDYTVRDHTVRDHTVRDRLDDRLEPRASTDGATPVRVALDGDDLGIE